MSDQIIGTSQAAIDGYEQQALRIFARVHDHVQQMVVRAFSLTYEGPEAESVFNPGLVRLAAESVGQIDSAMVAFAQAVSAVTSNISRSLGAGDILFTYNPPPLDLPAPPGVAADDYRLDVAGFETFIGADLGELESTVSALFAENQAAFEAIARATVQSPGWSGAARDFAQNVVVPTQTENLNGVLRQVVQQIGTFMTSAKNGTLSADQSGVGTGAPASF